MPIFPHPALKDNVSVQVCPSPLPGMPSTGLFLTLTTLYSNIQEPFLQWVVLVFLYLFLRVTVVCLCSMCSHVMRAHQLLSVKFVAPIVDEIVK